MSSTIGHYVDGAKVAGDAADDLQLRHIGIGGRGEAGGIFQPERDLGMGARGAGAQKTGGGGAPQAVFKCVLFEICR